MEKGNGIKKKGDRNCTGELRPDGDWLDYVILPTSMGRFPGNRADRLGCSAGILGLFDGGFYKLVDTLNGFPMGFRCIRLDSWIYQL